MFKTILFVGLVVSAASASAANLNIDFTQTPTAFDQDAFWDSFSSTTSSFTGTFLSAFTANGTDNIAIVDQATGTLLDTIALSFDDGGCGGGCDVEENFSGTVVQGIDSGTAPGGYVVVFATNPGTDYTAALGNLPANITLQATENPLSTPEPASFGLFALGALALLALRKSKTITL